tara:strand:+ start:2654 stop:3175 length:522 start_codon:yes stop_codon:yes gene_type:complete
MTIYFGDGTSQATASGGKILQVKIATKTGASAYTIGSGNNEDLTGLSESITPSSSSNKILILYNINYDTDENNGKGGFKIFRGSTEIGSADSAGSRYLVNSGFGANANQDQSVMHAAGMWLDSPSTTSSTTYKIAMHGGGTEIICYVNRGRADPDQNDDPRTASELVLMEVAG